jgi:hypothetical protein
MKTRKEGVELMQAKLLANQVFFLKLALEHIPVEHSTPHYQRIV